MARNENNLDQIMRLGIGYDDAVALRRASMTLRRWFELACGDSNDYASVGLERDEATNIPYRVVRPHTSNEARRYRVPDRETAARKRALAIVAKYPGLSLYVQGDPRGCALYILRPSDHIEGHDVDSYYSRGIPVY